MTYEDQSVHIPDWEVEPFIEYEAGEVLVEQRCRHGRQRRQCEGFRRASYLPSEVTMHDTAVDDQELYEEIILDRVTEEDVVDGLLLEWDTLGGDVPPEQFGVVGITDDAIEYEVVFELEHLRERL